MLQTFLKTLLILTVATAGILAQPAQVPFGTDHILVFIEPFRDLGPDTTQPWLEDGLRTFLTDGLADKRKVDVYPSTHYPEEWYQQPHRLQEAIWSATFERPVDERFETYLVRGTYSLVDEHLTVNMELYFLKNMHRADQLTLKDRYAQVGKWKRLLGDWLEQRIQTRRSVRTEVLSAQDFFPAEKRQPVSTDLKQRLGSMLERKSRQNSTELFDEYQRQSRTALGSELERLWHDVAFDPYLAEIHNIHAERDRMEPDSVTVTFQVTYRINPRILDEINHFAGKKASLSQASGEYQGHVFMDLGYTDQEFIDHVADGTWRLTPIVTVGPPNYPERRIFYHSDPQPIRPPTRYHHSSGQFRQLLVGLAGVNALRIYTMEESSTYEYSTRVGHAEMPMLDKITVHFVLEKDLHRKL